MEHDPKTPRKTQDFQSCILNPFSNQKINPKTKINPNKKRKNEIKSPENAPAAYFTVIDIHANIKQEKMIENSARVCFFIMGMASDFLCFGYFQDQRVF
jgi:hypothetical protein